MIVASSLRRGRALGALLLVQGCGSPPPPEPAPPPPQPEAPSTRDRAAAALRELREAAEASPAVRAALDVDPAASPAEQQEAWRRGRDAFRRLVTEGGLRRLTEVLRPFAPTPAVLTDASRLALMERLLTRAAGREVPLGVPAGEEPLLGRLLAAGMAARWEPRVDARGDPPSPETGVHPAYEEPWAPYHAALGAGGRRWRTLRGLEDFAVPSGPAQGQNPRVRIQTFGGTAFEDPAAALGGPAFRELYRPRDRERFRLAPRELDLALEPPRGDLYLMLVAWDLTRSTHLELALPGEERTLRLVVSRPDVIVAGPGPPNEVPAGLALRVRESALPEGLRGLRLRAVGVQGVGRPEATVLVGEVLQHVGGPPPEVFEGHAWSTAGPTDADAHRRRQEQLAATLRRLKKGPAGGRTPDALLEAARAFREAGDLELAATMARRAARLRPEHPVTLNLLGEILWDAGDRKGAVNAWERSRAADPAGRAAALLQEHAPGAAARHHRVTDPQELLEIAEVLRDFRRLREIQRALVRLARAGEPAPRLDASNQGEVLAALHEAGHLRRPGGLPSGRGFMRTRPDGRVESRAYGRPRDLGEEVPAALEARGGWSVTESVIVAALETGAAAAVEVLLPRLDDAGLRRALPGLAPALTKVTDPWAADVLASRVRRLREDGAEDAVRGYESWYRSWEASRGR